MMARSLDWVTSSVEPVWLMLAWPPATLPPVGSVDDESAKATDGASSVPAAEARSAPRSQPRGRARTATTRGGATQPRLPPEAAAARLAVLPTPLAPLDAASLLAPSQCLSPPSTTRAADAPFYLKIEQIFRRVTGPSARHKRTRREVVGQSG